MKKGLQEQICAKIDNYTWSRLQLHCQQTGRKKNRVINEALKRYLDDYNDRPFAYM